jgi:hypothetical protein
MPDRDVDDSGFLGNTRAAKRDQQGTEKHPSHLHDVLVSVCPARRTIGLARHDAYLPYHPITLASAEVNQG